MPGVMGEQPIRVTGHGRQKYRNIGSVSNQVAIRVDKRSAWIGNELRISQCHEAIILLDELVGLKEWQPLGVK